MLNKGIICITNFFSLNPIRAGETVTKAFVLSLLDNGYHVAVLVPNFDKREHEKLQTLRSSYDSRLRVYSVTGFKKETLEKSFLLRVLISIGWYAFLTIRGITLRDNGHFPYVVSLYHPTHLASLSAHIISRLRRIPHIIWVRDLIPATSKEQSWLELLPYSIVQKIACMGLVRGDLSLYISEEIRQLAIRKYSLRKTAVLPSLVDTSERLSSASLPISFDKSEKTIMVAYIGELFPSRIRGLAILLKAIKRLVLEKYDVKLMMIGHGYKMPEFLNKIRELQLEDHIILLGKVENSLVPHYLMKADIGIGVLNNDSDTVGTLPMKTLEYMVAGLPIINAASCVASNAVIDRFNGILVPVDDDAAVADAIKLLINDTNLRKLLGKNARRHVEENYSISSITRKFESLLLQVK